MPSDYEKLTDREIDALIQERFVPPYPADRCRICGWTLDPEGIMCTPTSCSLRPPPERHADAPAHYSTDDRAARSVRDRIAELGLIDEYESELAALIFESGNCTSFLMQQATPRQQCIAALRSLDTRETAGDR